MHRVLSYQTAMRASSSRDIREYVTKRTCVSLILSIAFFTLIAGFLLGKFVSDRQHHMRNLRELSKTDEYLLIKEAKENLMKQAQNYTLISSSQSQQHKSNANNETTIPYLIYEKYMKCYTKIEYLQKYMNLPVDIFLEEFLIQQISKQLECLNTLKDYLQNL